MRACILALLLGPSAFAADAWLPYSGRVLNANGDPVTGEQDPRVTLYSDAAGTVDVWRTTLADVQFEDGYFSVALTGDDATMRSLDVALASGPLWVGLSVDGTTDLGAPQRMASRGYVHLDEVDETCIPGLAGVLRYQSARVELCDGSAWVLLYEPGINGLGGTITTFGGDRIHIFTESGTFIASGSGTASVLLVGGGGAGGASLSGGGGGGAVLYNDSVSITPGNYPIVVGAGGVGVADHALPGGNGGSTSAFGVTATGGGGGAGRYSITPTGGANGGGAPHDSPRCADNGIGVAPSAPAGWTVHAGFDGGQGQCASANNYPGGGGAGAGNNGQTPSSSTAAGGNGGGGVAYDITGTLLYWGGGGGGSSYTGSNGGGNGGIGGGGGGSANAGPGGTGGGSALNAGGNGLSGGGSTTASQRGGDGGANTGGGGGAGNHQPGRGGDGGSGVVIIRY